ncbi:MAG: thymidine phosphorylase [Pseudobdellovibrionaceae bacterium]
MFLPSAVIKKKRQGEELTEKEIQFFINGYTEGSIPDYQMSALLMAIYFQGMTKQETLHLTDTMIHSGKIFQFPFIQGFKVDKHSTGGVGDKTSLILGPLVACHGFYVPMMSGRGLGHTGGTIDKLESIPGFRIDLGFSEFQKNLVDLGVCFIGQTGEVCPADKKIYGLRDVTATVESLPLICASIMSKKIAEGSDAIVLDVKYGTGAFMKTAEAAEKLAQGLIEVAQAHHKKCTAFITNMNQPLGRFSGNALEVKECISIMKGEMHIGPSGYDLYEDTRELSLQLSAEMLFLSGKYKDFQSCYDLSKETLQSGKALKKFEDMCHRQGGDLTGLASTKLKLDVLAESSGYVETIDTERVGYAGVFLKAGRQKTSDLILPAPGIEFHYKVGDVISQDQPMYTLHGNDPKDLQQAMDYLKSSFIVTKQKVDRLSLIHKHIGE